MTVTVGRVVTLTIENLEAAAAIRRSLPSWDDADTALEQVGQRFPSNTERSSVLVKASAIDKLYSTRAGNIYWVAEAVVEAMQEEERQRSSGETVEAIGFVDMISSCKCRRHSEARRCASFASKYCHFFVPGRDFPIYDSFAQAAVNRVLGKPQRGLTPNRSEYRDFCERINRVRTRDGLEHVGVRELDRFLWLWGQWLAQQGKAERVINSDVYEVLFGATDRETSKHVQALKPQDARVESPDTAAGTDTLRVAAGAIRNEGTK